MKLLPAFSVIVALASIPSCASNEIGHSKDVNQDEINQGYFISYDQQRNRTEVTAFFRFAGANGTTLILDEPSKVTMNGEMLHLKEEKSLGAYYTQLGNGKLADGEYVFQFSDTQGKTFSNSLTWRDLTVISAPDTVAQNQDLLITFSNDPVRRNETMEIEISDTAQTITETIKHQIGKNIRIDASRIKGLKGEVQIRMTRYGDFNLKQQAHAGGFIQTELRIKPLWVVIK